MEVWWALNPQVAGSKLGFDIEERLKYDTMTLVAILGFDIGERLKYDTMTFVMQGSAQPIYSLFGPWLLYFDSSTTL